VNLPAASGRSDINHEIVPEDNRYLIVHEGSGFGPGDGQSSQVIRDFITNRTDQGRANSERLHAIWVCIPTSDATSGSIGEGFEDILNLRRVPVIVAFTKFDQVVRIEGGSSERTSARARVEHACRSIFRKEPRDVPAEIVSVKPQFSDLIDNLVVTTDRFITGSRTRAASTSARSSAHGAKPRITPVPLMWSAALRVHQDIFIQASIEVGRSRYWRGLWSSLDFADQPLKDCVNVIHTDIVEIWNLKDRDKHLSDPVFKEKMSHVVQDLAGSAASVPSSDFAEWVYDVYRGSQENVRCVMGYIVDLTVILDDIFRTAAGNVTANDVRSAVDRHVNSGRRDRIHRDIQSFVTETFAIRFTVPQRDLVLEKIIDLIRQYCVPG